MPRNRQSPKPVPFKRAEIDLTAMLDVEQLKQLQVLMSAIMDEVQNQVRENFDKLTINQIEPTEGISAPKAPLLTIPTSLDAAVAESKKSDVELAIASLNELKRDALGHFAKWRGLVTKRLQEIVVKNGGASGKVGRQGSQHAPVRLTTGEASNAQHIHLYPPMYTALLSLQKTERALILHTMFLLLLGLDQYPTYSRITLLKLATAIGVPTFVLLQDEYRVAQALAQIIKDISAEEVAQRRAEEGKPPKRWRSGGVYNPAGVSTIGTLAEPLVVAGVGTVFGGFGVSTSVTAVLLGGVGAASSTVPVGTLFGLYGARQGGKTMDAYAKDIQDFGLLPLHGPCLDQFIDPKDVPAENRRMRVTVGISGWRTGEKEFFDQWKIIGKATEVYTLRWELEALSKVGAALQTMTNSAAWTLAMKDTAQMNVFTSLQTSYWPASLVRASKVMDNPWIVAMVRAEKTGVVLAEVLANKVQGERAVSLVGYGLGARVIYACLTALSEKRAFGVVENAILFGAPCPAEVRVWAAMKSIVMGRLINVYSKHDYLLGFLYRTCAWNFGVAGLQPIEGVPRVENIDLSDYIVNHLDYEAYVGSVLLQVRWEDADSAEINKHLPKRPLAPIAPVAPVAPATLEPRTRSGNIINGGPVRHTHRDGALNRQPTRRGGLKDRTAPKSAGNRALQSASSRNGQIEQGAFKARNRHTRTENQRSNGTHRQETR
ncbi:DUF726-domain-containing protein [Poronia punctata]|nr:DUF726-domain-containing protein [Poronia punctata]